ECIERFGRTERRAKRLKQIEGNWGRFEPVQGQAAGKGATLQFRFRNATHVRFTAYRIKIDLLLEDIMRYLESKPMPVDRKKLNISNIGYRIVCRDERRYLGEQVAEWEMELEPAPRHWDRRVTVTTPLQQPGAYLIKAQVRDGNLSRIVMWLSETAIVKKRLADGTLLNLLDARDGRPLPGMQVQLFGFRIVRRGPGRRDLRLQISRFSRESDGEGKVLIRSDEAPQEFQWLIIARDDRRLAFLGFSSLWPGWRQPQWPAVRQRAFAITDRPVYKPGDTVQFKLWVRQASYELKAVSIFAGRPFQVQIRDPRGTKVFQKLLVADEYGGIEGEFKLPQNASLGRYSLSVPRYGGTWFRVEEYRKPEYEVTVEGPKEPIKLGEAFSVTIKAKYYFGEPVTEAKVKYRVMRRAYRGGWFPVRPWDWLYGPGYWCQRSMPNWLPRGATMHMIARRPAWLPWPAEPPELVAEGEIPIGSDGTVQIQLDTSLTAELFGDRDHRYEIIAEVTDKSRRTIVGSGHVVAARKAFQVFVAPHRGYYRVGDTVKVHIDARTIEGKPVSGDCKLVLYRLVHKPGGDPPDEVAVQSWQLQTDAEGRARAVMKASAAGQYRISATVTDADGRQVEGAVVLTIIGDAVDPSLFRFNDLELALDKEEYRPGD
ncbi:MAG TPA: alpha-2-macroglobulin, partial [Planctomycetaceae bacterium]|nr:alpha-2-macroglobulin [Planctomycetaceae bacterium]